METIGDRIKKRRLELKLTQAFLGKTVGVERAAVSLWETGQSKTLKGENLLNVADALGVLPKWLTTGEGPMHKNDVGEQPAGYATLKPGPPIYAGVPLISWVQAGNWSEIVDNFQPGDAEDWYPTTAKVGPNAFALRVHGDSMMNPHGKPSIPEGSVVIVDPDIQADNGKIVVARLEGSNEATLKKLVIDGSKRYLKPLNPAYPVIEIDSECTICGVVLKYEVDL